MKILRRSFLASVIGFIAGCVLKLKPVKEECGWEITYGWDKYIAVVFDGISTEMCKLTTTTKNLKTGEIISITHEDIDLDEYRERLKQAIVLSDYMNGGRLA